MILEGFQNSSEMLKNYKEKKTCQVFKEISESFRDTTP
jgi:hypothetical protein